MPIHSNEQITGFLGQQSSTTDLIRSVDWEETILGSYDSWPQSLKSALSICINSNFPIAIYWGPDLILLYNEAWSPIPGSKHPWAFGKSAEEVWPDIWPAIQPQFEKAFTGEAGGSKDALLPMQRFGYTEECYFDFTFTPIYGESGKVEGIFNAVIETTYRLINERRAGILQGLGEALAGSHTTSEVFNRAINFLSDARLDISFMYIYGVADTGLIAINATRETAASTLLKPWPAADVIASGSVHHISHLGEFLSPVPEGFWPELPREGLIIPVKSSDGATIAVIVAGASSRRRIDKDYRAFFDSISNMISAEINTLNSLTKERERVESLTQIDRAKTAFFSNISHEFRTPLTLMLSPLQEVLNNAGNLSAAQRENLETCFRNSLRLQKLVDTLLDFSKIEAGKMQPEFRKVDLAEVTRDIASSFRSAIESSGLLYHVNIGDLPQAASIDIDMWEKIVLNLLSNAFKYTDAGKISIHLHALNNHALLEVSDTGLGVNKDHLDKIFERFYRVSNHGGRSQEGTGIGLSMVRELVQLHGGEITVASEPGVGSTFSVSIPLSSASLSSALSDTHYSGDHKKRKAFIQEAETWISNGSITTSPQTAEHVGGYKPKVVVADDNRDMRDYIYRLLREDFDVHMATNGQEALELIASITPELIISDIMMPGIDGFELLKIVRANLSTRLIPFIFLSARAGDEAKVEGIEAGADDYLVKPFSARELLARVTNHIAIKGTRSKTEQEFFRLFMQSPAHIHVFRGPDHVVDFFHPLGVKAVGRDITGMRIREALPEFKDVGYFETLDDVFLNGKTITVSDNKTILKDEKGNDTEHYFHITYVPWRGIDGNIQGVLQFSLDVTDQSKTNQRIRESEERFRILSNSIPQIVWIAEPDGRMQYLSDQWEHYTGVKSEHGRQHFSEFIHEADVAVVRSRWSTSKLEKKEWSAEFRLKNINSNTYTWFWGHTVPMLDEQGHVMRWIGSASDINVQKTEAFELENVVAQRTTELVNLNSLLTQKNDELSRARTFLQTVLDSSVELVTAFDRNLNYAFVNKRLTSISDRQPEQLIGRNILDVEPGFESTDGYQYLHRALNGETIHLQTRTPHIDNSLIFETFVIPLQSNGEVHGVITMQRDITAMTRLTEQLRDSNELLKRSNDDLQQFAHVTSHDLKEPVRKIALFGDILMTEFGDHLPAKAMDTITRINKATSRISAMIDGILQFSTVDVSDHPSEPVALNEVIDDILEDLEIVVRENNAIITHVKLPTIKGFRMLIYQLFYNLINNALKFRSAERNPVINIDFHPASEEEDLKEHFRITVADNGIGFSQHHAEKIFNSFTRLNPKDRYEGTGLGLALCRKIVTRHHGKIAAVGEPDKGSRFHIDLPANLLV